MVCTVVVLQYMYHEYSSIKSCLQSSVNMDSYSTAWQFTPPTFYSHEESLKVSASLLLAYAMGNFQYY